MVGHNHVVIYMTSRLILMGSSVGNAFCPFFFSLFSLFAMIMNSNCNPNEKIQWAGPCQYHIRPSRGWPTYPITKSPKEKKRRYPWSPWVGGVGESPYACLAEGGPFEMWDPPWWMDHQPESTSRAVSIKISDLLFT